MNCLRCGLEVEAPNVFCPKCQEEMARYPVSRDAAVILPTREPRPPRKAYVPVDPQEQLQQLRKKYRRQRRTLWAVISLCVILLGLLLFVGDPLLRKGPTIGQNYQSNSSSQSTSARKDPSVSRGTQ